MILDKFKNKKKSSKQYKNSYIPEKNKYQTEL